MKNREKYNMLQPKLQYLPDYEKINPDYSVSTYPRVIRIEPSSLCNLNCIHCPTGTKKDKVKNKGNMTDDVFHKIIEEIRAYSCADVVVLYHGGEPFLNKNILRMSKELKDIGVRFIKTVTNGTVIKDEMLTSIIRSGLDSVEFSIDGLSPEENNQIRRGADYNTVVETIKKLISLKDKLGANNPDIYIANTQIPSEKDIKNGVLVSTPKNLLDEFSKLEKKIGFKNTYMLKWPEFDCSDKYKLVEGSTVNNSSSSNYCNHVIDTITFRWNGDIVPCCYDITSNYVIGNIMEQSLADIWNNERYKELRRSIHLKKYIPLCSNCNVIRPQLYVVKK